MDSAQAEIPRFPYLPPNSDPVPKRLLEVRANPAKLVGIQIKRVRYQPGNPLPNWLSLSETVFNSGRGTEVPNCGLPVSESCQQLCPGYVCLVAIPQARKVKLCRRFCRILVVAVHAMSRRNLDLRFR